MREHLLQLYIIQHLHSEGVALIRTWYWPSDKVTFALNSCNIVDFALPVPCWQQQLSAQVQQQGRS